MKYLAQIVFIQILWHQFYKLYNNNLNANIFIQIIFLSMKLNVHWNHPLWLNTPFTFCDSPIEIIPSSRRVPRPLLPGFWFECAKGVLSHNSYKFNALFKKSTTFCICFQLELHFLLAHKKLLTFSIRSQLLLLFLRYIKK